jgi:hypothetical protein
MAELYGLIDYAKLAEELRKELTSGDPATKKLLIELLRQAIREELTSGDANTRKLLTDLALSAILKDWVKNFPRGEWTEPGKKSFGTVIIPRGGSIRVQDVEISNDLDLDIEVTFMVAEERLKHVSIGKLEKAEQK